MRRMLHAGEGLCARVRAHALARSVLLVGAAAVLVKGASSVKDIALAGIFGCGDELKVFLIALLLPAALATIIAEAFAPSITTPLTQILRTGGVERREARAFLGAMTSFASYCYRERWSRICGRLSTGLRGQCRTILDKSDSAWSGLTFRMKGLASLVLYSLMKQLIASGPVFCPSYASAQPISPKMLQPKVTHSCLLEDILGTSRTEQPAHRNGTKSL